MGPRKLTIGLQLDVMMIQCQMQLWRQWARQSSTVNGGFKRLPSDFSRRHPSENEPSRLLDVMDFVG